MGPMIVLGRIVAPYGVQGWVKIHPFGDDPDSWRKMPTWWLAPSDEVASQDWKPFSLSNCKVHGKSLVASFQEVPDRTAAETMGGWFIAVPREALPKPAADEFYWGDLVGLEVINAAGLRLGVVDSLISTGAHDVLKVRDGEAERLIPFVGAYIGEVDLAAGRMTVEWEADW